MSTFMSAHSASQHSIDADLDSETIDCLPSGLMEHRAFNPHMWRKQNTVVILSKDGVRFAGRTADVSMATGRVLIMVIGRIPAKA